MRRRRRTVAGRALLATALSALLVSGVTAPAFAASPTTTPATGTAAPATTGTAAAAKTTATTTGTVASAQTKALTPAAAAQAAAKAMIAAQKSSISNSSAATAPTSSSATSATPKSKPLPKAPIAMHQTQVVQGSRMAPFVLPIHVPGTSGLGGSSQLDTAVLPVAILSQRTYFSAMQQWKTQGAKPVPASTRVSINPTHYQSFSGTKGQPGPKILPAGSVGGNTGKALGWPETVKWIQFPVTVKHTGLYQLHIRYYDYPTCYTAGKTSVKAFTSNATASNSGPWCGRGTAAVRGIQIDPPGTVKTVASTVKPPSVPASILAAAKSSGLNPSSLPGWINPQRAYVPVSPSPAWAIPSAKTPTANACALNLTGPTGPTGYNGYQYQDARQVPFPGLWTWQGMTINPKTGYASFPKDNRGDNLYPVPAEAEVWQTIQVHDILGTYRNPLQFCLPKGHHVLRLVMVREPMAIQSITFQGAPAIPSYQQYVSKWQAKGLKPVNCGLCLEVQAEAPYRESASTIRPGSTSYPSIVPHSNGYYILNELDGNFWQLPDKSITYKITAPHSGFYKLGFKILQAGMQGLPATRQMTIDGKVPFNGAQWVSFPFRNAWNMVTFSQPNGKPALIALTKGTHYIRFRTSLGMVGQVLAVIQQVTQRLGELQREVIMIAGPNPNPNVSYNLAQNVPGLIPQLKSIVHVLHQQAAILTYDAGGVSPTAANSINITASDIQQMADHPHQIKLDMVRWQQNEAALASWITQLQSQAVSMDWFAFASPSYRFPSPSANILQQLAATWDTFILSFYRNYTGVGSRYSKAIKVWVGYGQTWAAIMSQMSQSEFTPATGIHVNFNVVPGGYGIVLLAQVAGHGPDLATGMPPTSPVDFAIRKGAHSFSSFPNWNVIKQRFVPQALVPYTYTNAKHQKAVYGVPETQGMTLMFYRKDIMKALHLPIPQTWPELYKELPVINSHGMEFYYAFSPLAASGGLLPFLYQNGGAFYTNTSNGIRAALNTPQAYQAFKQWTNLYTQWQVPLAANIFTRFQTGQVPLAIGGYPEFVQLSVAAPQIAGLWGISTIPSTPYECTSKGCTVVQTGPCAFPTNTTNPHQPGLPSGTYCKWNGTAGDLGGQSNVILMPRSAKHPNEAWKFVEWWTSTNAQLEFANNIEAIGGVQVAWNTANIQALRGLPWSETDLRVFAKAWSQFQPLPVVPGGYISDRYINSIWTNVVVDGQNARSQLRWATQNINDELYRQEIQFGLTKKQAGRIAVGA